MRTPERRTVFHNFSPDFPSIFHLKLFSLLSFDTGKSQNDNGHCVHKAICQTNHHVDEFLPLHFVCCKCHTWVKLCAEQLCGFCTSRSRIGCGKLPLQLVISLFAMPPLYLYIIIPFTRIESKIAQ